MDDAWGPGLALGARGGTTPNCGPDCATCGPDCATCGPDCVTCGPEGVVDLPYCVDAGMRVPQPGDCCVRGG